MNFAGRLKRLENCAAGAGGAAPGMVMVFTDIPPDGRTRVIGRFPPDWRAVELSSDFDLSRVAAVKRYDGLDPDEL